MSNVFDFAKFFIKKGLDDTPNTMDGNMKLQKLLTFANITGLALNGKPLFDEPIYAYEHGCVVEKVRLRYREDYDSFVQDSKEFNPDFTAEEYRALNATIGIFGKISAKELSEINHLFNFWKVAYDNSLDANGYKDKERSVVNVKDIEKELYKFKDMLSAYEHSLTSCCKKEVINGVTFYFDPTEIKLTDDVMVYIENFSLDADENAYTICKDESVGLVVY